MKSGCNRVLDAETQRYLCIFEAVSTSEPGAVLVPFAAGNGWEVTSGVVS